MAPDVAEERIPPQRRDASFYAVLVLLVAPVWAVVPLSWLFAAYSLLHLRFRRYSLPANALFLVACAEVLFSAYYYLLTRRVSRPSTTSPTNMFELQDAFKRVLQSGLASLPNDGGDEASVLIRPTSPAQPIEQLAPDDHRAIDFRNRLRTWFRGVPWSQVRREHMEAWLYWSTFNAPLPLEPDMPQSHRMLIDEAIAWLEKRIGCTIPTGQNPNVKPLLLTIDPINVSARPLIWYLFVKGANFAIRSWYGALHGLKYGRFEDLEYLIRVPPNYSRHDGPDPVVFLHGLGLGVFQYQQALSHFLSELPDTPFLIPIQPQISQDIFHPRFLKPMLRHEKVACLSGLLEKLGWVGPSAAGDNHGVTLLSHSNGTYVHAWILKSFPNLVKRSCFVDPVTFCSWEGDVCHNFIYQRCATGVQLVIRYFVGSELGVLNLLQRHFDWLSNSLWFEEVPNACDPQRSLFLLGGKDCIVDAERVRKYLTSHGVRKGLWFDPGARHGEALITGQKGMAKVIEWIKDCPSKY